MGPLAGARKRRKASVKNEDTWLLGLTHLIQKFQSIIVFHKVIPQDICKYVYLVETLVVICLALAARRNLGDYRCTSSFYKNLVVVVLTSAVLTF